MVFVISMNNFPHRECSVPNISVNSLLIESVVFFTSIIVPVSYSPLFRGKRV